MIITCIPAYRDYKNARDLRQAFHDNKDFMIVDLNNPYCGKYINKQDCINHGVDGLKIRYRKSTRVEILRP